MTPEHKTGAAFVGWSPAERISLITLTYVDVAIYGLLLLLALRNVWVVVLQH